LKGDVRPVLGIRGAFVLGDPVLAGAVSAASSGSEYAVADTGTELVVIRNRNIIWRTVAPRAEAYSFRSDGQPEWVRFADGSCIVWTSSGEPERSPSCLQQTARNNATPIKLPEGAATPEPVAAGWVSVRTPEHLYLASTESEEAIFEVPEAREP
jgi:hypothetical protein